MRAAVALLALAALLAGCAQPPPPPRLLATQELKDLVRANTLHVQATASGAATNMLLYLAPDGSGWLDRALPPGASPIAGGMRQVLRWGLTGNSGICIVATPRIGEMPSQMPLLRECLQVLATPAGLIAVIAQDDRSVQVPLAIAPGNGFPPRQTAAFLERTAALYGGRMPVWPAATLPAP